MKKVFGRLADNTDSLLGCIAEKNILTQSPVPLQRRRLLLAGGALFLSPSLAPADAQCEETLSDDVVSVMRGPISSVNPSRLVFAPAQEGKRWLSVMSSRLARYVPGEGKRHRLLVSIQYETS